MELFSITCTTCKSRLKVRDQAAVGQILACPKCGGMVMIKPPPVWSESSEQKSDLATATEIVGAASAFNQTLDSSAFDVVDELLSDSPPKMQPPPSFTPPPGPAPSATPKPRFVGGPPAQRPPAPAAPPAKPSATPQPTAIHNSDPLPPPPPGETVVQPPPARSARRYWMFMAGSVALGVFLALAAVTAAIIFLGPAKRPPTGAIATIPVPTAPNGNGLPAPSTSPAPNSDLPAETSSAPVQGATPSPPASPEATASTLAAPLATGSDPLGLVKNVPVAASGSATASDPLARFDRLIGGASDDPLAKAADSGPKPATPVLPDTEPGKPTAPRPPAREIDLAKRLADPLPRIQTAGTPLAVFLQLMSDLSTIPITLEPDALPLVRATAESPVKIDAANTTLGGALTQALAGLGLEAVESEGQLVVRVAEPAALRTYAYPMKNLAADADAMAEMAETLQALVEPGSWGDQPDQGEISIDAAKATLTIRQRQAVHAILVFACEKLRTARGKPHASTRFDPSLYELASRTAKAKDRLETPVSLNYSQPTRLVTVLQRLGEAAGVRILVDWRDIAAAGWNPAGEASVVASKQPLAAALDSLLGPLDLTWRVINGHTLQVVTPTRLVEQCESELYKVDDLGGSDSSGEALVAKVHTALGEAAFRGGGGSCEIRYDADGKCLLAWLPQPKQRELEALLAKWRSEKGK